VFENIVLALQGVWSHKMRSFLTMLGIIIGIASIITIVSTIKGTNELIKENLIGAGTNVVTVQVYQEEYPLDMAYAPLPEGVQVITEETRAALEELDGVQSASLYRKRTYVEGVFYQNYTFNGELYGVDPYYFDVNGYKLSYGRNFIEKDFDRNGKVVILDSTAVSTLFNGKNPVGETIEIMSEPFTVIGVVAKSNDFKPTINSVSDYHMYADTSSGRLFIPTDSWSLVYRFDEPQNVAVRATSTDEMTTAGKNVADSLTESQIVDNTEMFSYRSEDLLEQAKQLQEMSNSTNRQLIWIASISLLVGGIGVMNIMLVSVTERTREIGLKKAIGAKKKRILGQFLTEAAVLTSIGGLCGVAVGLIMAKLLSVVMLTRVAVSVPAILIAVIFSMVIGVVFGLLPAMKAAKLNPIDALRRE
jgi:putative ABC transport system permease protein